VPIWQKVDLIVEEADEALAPRAVDEVKAARWTDAWPELTVLPWPT
jgi:uncharacterized protein